MQCVARCGEFETWRTSHLDGVAPDNGRRIIVWYDDATRSSGIEMVESAGTVVPGRRAFALSVGENHITGHGRRFYLQFSYVIARPNDPSLRVEMTRRPGAFGAG